MAPKSLQIQTTVPLKNNGKDVQMPLLGFGVWQAPSGNATRLAVGHALKTGYRHIDTAALYGNEADVGYAINKSGIPRSETFVTTKLWNSDQGYDSALKAFDASMDRLGLEYVDLYLLHYPVPGKRLESWNALQEIQADGRARAIGVSNFTVRHLKELLDKSPVRPAVNQVEFSPFLYQRELLDFCTEHGIRLQAYSPLTHGVKLKDPTLARLGKEKGATPAQILLRWCLQHGVSPLPKSITASRIEENAGLYHFELSAKDMAELDGLNENLRTCWDPSNEP